tara:strand:- start:253 stop:471 length:219 start_codon:yes stop_codon:yes gene_type:complete
MNNYLKISIVVVVVCGLVFHETKPRVFFDELGDFKSFGLKNDDTIIPLWLALTLIGLIVYNVQILNGGKYII